MFGTILAVLDGYSRSLQRTVELFSRQEHTIHAKFRLLYVVFLIAITSGSFVVVSHFQNNLKELVDFATILSFLVAPVIAIFNFKLVTGTYLPKDDQQSKFLKVLSFSGIVFLSVFAAIFLIIKFTS